MSKPDAAVVVIKAPGSDHAVLGVSRPLDAHDFGLPGGSVEPGEDAALAAAREVMEETGLEVEVRLLEAIPYRGRTVHAFVATRVTGTPRASAEGVVAWVTWAQLERGTYGDFNERLHAKYFAPPR